MAISDGLPRMHRLLDELGHPEKDLKIIHIAGTNGKGSTAIMIASILEAAGYSVGLFTSPHLITENERIQIWDGKHSLIEQERLDELLDFVRGRLDEKLHVFEEYTSAAYLYFAEQKPDYVVMECGLGGRLDSTNTIDKPLVSVITKVGLDHTAELGNTIIKVAREKSGIIKPGVPVVSQTMDMTVKSIIHKAANEKGCSFTDVSVLVDNYKKYKLGMIGSHQVANAATAVEAIKAAKIDVTVQDIEKGLASATNPGRFEVLREKPYVIIDGAHNPDAVESLIDTFDKFTREHKIKRTLVIFGCMRDKNSLRMVQLLTHNLRGCSYYSVPVDSDRTEDPERIAELFSEQGRGCTCFDFFEEAFTEAMKTNSECILVTGSIYLAGTMKEYYLVNN